MKLNKFLFISGVSLISTGTIAGYAGYKGVALFLRGYDNSSYMSVLTLMKGLIFPHILMLLGFGMISFGLIMIARGFFFMKRIESYND